MANRGDVDAVDCLLRHGANGDALYAHWGSEVTAMQLAILVRITLAFLKCSAVVRLCRVDECNETVKHIVHRNELGPGSSLVTFAFRA